MLFSVPFLARPPLKGAARIDVIIPARNRAHLLPTCLESVANQTCAPDKVFVIDDGSTDDTSSVLAAFAQRWPRLCIIETAGVGVSAARNLALARSTADLIAFLDSDDAWYPTMLERLVKCFSTGDEQLGFANCGFRQVDANGRALPGQASNIPSKRGDIFRAILEEFYGIAPSTLMVRRDLAVSIGGFDESLVQAEDRDFCLRLAHVSASDFVPEVLVDFRRHDGSAYDNAMQHNPELVLSQRLRVWDRWFEDIDDLDAVVQQFRSEAALTGRWLLRNRLDIGLPRRLKRSESKLAKLLFPTTWDFALAMVPAWPSALPQLKSMVANRVIAPNPRLLRLAQKFGRLKGWEPTRGQALDDGNGR